MINKKTISVYILVALVFTSCTLTSKKELENSFVVKVSTDKFLWSLSSNSNDEKFHKALNLANEMQGDSNENYITRFGKAFSELSPDAQLAGIFSTVELRKSISFNSTNEEVLGVLQRELDQVINQAINILKVRIKRYGIRHHKVARIGNSENILIELPAIENIERVRGLIEAQAKLEFWETYEASEIYSYMENVNANLPDDEKIASAIEMKVAEMDGESGDFVKKYPLFAFLYPAVDATGQLIQGPVVGYAAIRDTSTVNYMMKQKSVQDILTRDLRFCWAYKPLPQDEAMLQLFALKVTTRDGDAPLDGSVITDVTEKHSNENVTIQMNMNDEGAKVWARLTRENIGRHLAIVLDKSVYTAPRVNAEITSGRCQISGDFTMNEAQDLANIIQASALPVQLSIVEEHVKTDKATKSME